jgi:uncharacterized protein (DUF305 family)
VSAQSTLRVPGLRPALAVAAVLLATVAVTGCGGGAEQPGTAAATSLDPAAAAEQDAAFATAMVEHHHQTLQLVGLAAAYAENAAVLQYAGELQTLHDTQMQELSSMLEGWGKPVPDIGRHEDLDGSIPGVLDKTQFSELTSGSPAAFEKQFLAALLAHQEKALPLAQKEAALGGDPQARALAAQIVKNTTAQLDALRALSTP